MSRADDLASAVESLHQAYAKLRHLGGDGVDAVVHAPSATTYLFPEIQAELRRMERTERQHAAERAAILDALPSHLAIVDEKGTIIALNEAWKAFARLQDYPDGTAALGKDYLEVCRDVTGCDPAVAQAMAKGLKQVLEGQSDQVSLEYPCHSAKAQHWFNVVIAPLNGAAQAGAVVMHLDITERHLASRREAELRGRIERLMDQAGIGILVHRDNLPIFANPALVNMLGLDTPDDILELDDVRRLFHLSQGNEIDALVGGGPASEPLGFRNRIEGSGKDGKALTFEARVFPITWGEELAVCAMFTDITDQIRVEDQLRAAQKLEAIGKLTGGIAHDFNNLLTVILGSGDLLVEALQHDPTLARLAEQTVMMAERGAELTKRLLAFARRQPLNPRPTDLNARLVELEDMLRRTLGADIEIDLALSDDLWSAMVDPGEFDSAILNLSINSRDAMPDGGRLSIRTANAEFDAASPETALGVLPGAYVVVTLSDGGCGMTQATLDRIFEPFFTTKDVSKGSGLGLSMVYGFVKQTGGHVFVTSNLNEGTTVKMYFLRFSGDRMEPDETARSRQVLHGQVTILVVEDNIALLQQITKVLSQLGFKVFAASEGEQALTILRERSDIDLLFTDIVLPGGMNGRQIADAAQSIRPKIKTLFTSGYSGDAIIEDGRLTPGVEFLSKPYRRGDLEAKIRKVLGS